MLLDVDYNLLSNINFVYQHEAHSNVLDMQRNSVGL